MTKSRQILSSCNILSASNSRGSGGLCQNPLPSGTEPRQFGHHVGLFCGGWAGGEHWETGWTMLLCQSGWGEECGYAQW